MTLSLVHRVFLVITIQTLIVASVTFDLFTLKPQHAAEEIVTEPSETENEDGGQ